MAQFLICWLLYHIPFDVSIAGKAEK